MIRANNEQLKEFETKVEVRQGCVLSPPTILHNRRRSYEKKLRKR